MDPTANLAEQRSIISLIREAIEDSNSLSAGGAFDDSLQRAMGLAERLAELVESLDEWITRGGFLPNQWQRSK